MDDPLRRFFVKWLPVVCQPFGIDRGIDHLMAIPRRQEAALAMFRPLRTDLPVIYGDAALLHPERAIVPFDFEHRNQDLKSLRTWCQDRSLGPVAWKLLTGPAGRGKTRLLMQLVEGLNSETGAVWNAGFLDVAKLRRHPEAALCFAEVRGDLLIVIDYAERFRQEVIALGNLMLGLGEFAPERRIRLVFISRKESELWTNIRYEERLIAEFLDADGMTSTALGQLAESESDLHSVYDSALQAFADVLNLEPALETRPDLSASEFSEVLLVHAAALYALRYPDDMQGLNRDKILAAVLDREQRLWQQLAASKGLSTGIGVHALKQAAEYLTLISLSQGIGTRDRAIALLSNCPRLAGTDAPTRGLVADIFAELYPGEGWISGITPDLIGTYLIAMSDDELIESAYGSAD